MMEWDRLLDQAFLTLNLLRPSRLNPSLSAYAYLFGQFDLNATPLAPPGTKTMMHSKPSNRASWDPNGRITWYIGPSMSHYRCVKVFVPKTHAKINTDTVLFFPKSIPIPSITTEDHLKQAATDIITLLTHPPKESPLPSNLQLGDTTKNALLQIATILGRNLVPPSVIQRQQRVTTAAAAALQRKLATNQPKVDSPITFHIPTPKAPTNSSSSNNSSDLKSALDRLARVLQSQSSRPAPKQYPSQLSSFRSHAARYLMAQ